MKTSSSKVVDADAFMGAEDDEGAFDDNTVNATSPIK
jgi:hypothetical protein